jgi:phosphinothricin acetyltransferase
MMRTGPVTIVAMTDEHARQVLAIYQAGIDEGDATFETVAPDWPEFTRTRLRDHRFIEHSVYVHPGARGRKIGKLLLAQLIASTEAAGIWTIQSGIFPENTASIALHQAAGFRIVGRRERLARHRGCWRDVLLLERRSGTV